MSVCESDVERFQADGAVLLRGIFRDWVARWLGDDARYAERAGKTSPPFPGLNLKHGDALDAAQFPLVHPA